MNKNVKKLIALLITFTGVTSAATVLASEREKRPVRGIPVLSLEREILESNSLSEEEKDRLTELTEGIQEGLRNREYDEVQNIYTEIDILVGNTDRETIEEERRCAEEFQKEIEEREKKEEEQRKEWDRQCEEEQKRIEEQLRLEYEQNEAQQEALEDEIKDVEVVSVSETEILESMEKEKFELQLKVMLSKFYLTKRDLEGYLNIFDKMRTAQKDNDIKSAEKYAKKIKVIIDYYVQFQ